jgi:hypothetical protein
MVYPRELPIRHHIEGNSSDCCLELDDKGFKENSGQGITSISKLVREGIAR